MILYIYKRIKFSKDLVRTLESLMYLLCTHAVESISIHLGPDDSILILKPQLIDTSCVLFIINDDVCPTVSHSTLDIQHVGTVGTTNEEVARWPRNGQKLFLMVTTSFRVSGILCNILSLLLTDNDKSIIILNYSI